MWFKGHLPNPLAIGIAAIAVMVFPMIGDHVYAALLRSNWILAIGPDTVLLNVRSYRNYRFEQANTVVCLAYDELDGAFQDVVRRSEDLGDGTATWREVSLCLQLSVSDVGQLKKVIADERKRKVTQKLLGGLITTTGRSNHAPIRVSQSGLIRVMWKSRYDFVRPRLHEALNELSKHINVQEDSSEGAEEAWRTLTDEQLDDRIVALVETGETLAAVKLLRLRRGYSITKAKKFVDELTGQLAN